MKEKLYTIPLNDAVSAGEECPFCYIERSVERDLMDFVLGSCSSYMESDVRDATDRAGFCRAHFKKMFDYGNTLGNGWILKTHTMRVNKEMKEQFDRFRPSAQPRMGRRGAFSLGKNSGGPGTEAVPSNPVAAWVRAKEDSCYICSQFRETYDRYLDTFFVMYKKDPGFRDKILKSKGFCLPHFGDLCEAADSRMNAAERSEFYPAVFELMSANMQRLQKDITWLVEKFDYRNKDADWKNSKDAIQRGMQKLKGGYPADPIYKMNK